MFSVADVLIVYYTLYTAIYTAFLISFSADLFYISKSMRLVQEEQ